MSGILNYVTVNYLSIDGSWIVGYSVHMVLLYYSLHQTLTKVHTLCSALLNTFFYQGYLKALNSTAMGTQVLDTKLVFFFFYVSILDI